MKRPAFTIVMFVFSSIILQAQEIDQRTYLSPGMFSIGTRNSFSIFNHDYGPGIGIGGQARVQLNNKLGSEWFADHIRSRNGDISYRTDYHFGWSLMYYPTKDRNTPKTLQPYILAGHCFDYSKVAEQADNSNKLGRWSMATQAGLGTHINFTNRFDCSISAQYMLHFGREIEARKDNGKVIIEKKNGSSPDGHFLMTLSFNYKLFHLF